jgi:hypothetical protein
MTLLMRNKMLKTGEAVRIGYFTGIYPRATDTLACSYDTQSRFETAPLLDWAPFVQVFIAVVPEHMFEDLRDGRCPVWSGMRSSYSRYSCGRILQRIRSRSDTPMKRPSVCGAGFRPEDFPDGKFNLPKDTESGDT